MNLDAAASTQGSRALVLDAQAPAWWDGWRAGLTLTAARDNRLGYYGVGNDSRYAPDSVSRAGQYFYEVSRTRYVGRATLQRRVVGPLRVLVGGTLAHSDFRALPGPSVFARDVAAGTLGAGATGFSDQVARAGLILDTRDNEVDPHRGLFVEGLLASGNGYTRRTTQARCYVPALERLVLAGRLGAEVMGGAPPLAAEQEMESSDGPFVALGGYRSLRGYYDGRFTGPGKLIGGLEVRYALVWAPSVFELKLVGFYDAGRVFAPGEAVRLTSDGLHHSGGAELALRVLRTSLLVIGYGRGPEGGELLFATSWSY